MKNSYYLLICIFTGVVFYQVLKIAGLPLWVIILCTPFFLYVQIFISNKYNFRKSLKFREIPARGYEKRIVELQLNECIFKNLGFRKIDEFYLPLSNDVVVFAFQHEEQPIVLCDYHFGNFNYCDFVCKFQDGSTLTTSNGENAGIVPRPVENMLQIFSGLTFDKLLEKHWHTQQFLGQKGFQLKEFSERKFRNWFLNDYKKTGRSVNNPLAPIRFIYWLLSNHKKKYLKPLQEQVYTNNLQHPKF